MKNTTREAPLRVALAQINPTVGDLEGNARLIAAAIQRAGDCYADLVIFPEQVVPGYPAEDLLLKHQFVKDNRRILKNIAAATRHTTAIVGCIGEGPNGALFNAAALLHNDKLVASYHKMHLPNYGVFDEKRYFTAGRGPLLFMLGGIPLGLGICEDIWVNHGPTDCLARAGSQVVVNISASPYHMLKGKEREAMLIARARANKIWIVYVNMVGGQDEIVFDGQSMVVDPSGQVIARAKAFQEDFLVLDIPIASGRQDKSPADSKSVRIVDLGARPCACRGGPRSRLEKLVLCTPPVLEEEILQALIAGTRDYVRKNGFEKVVLGMSGGVDSALVAAIAVEALGKDNVVALFMPSRFSSVQSLEDARNVGENLGIRLETVGIDPVFQSYLTQLKPLFGKLSPDITEENIQARIRGNILMAFSNKFKWLVLTTGNKSETSVGYCTLYGDMAGGFAMIKDLFKEWVYRLAHYINRRNKKEIIPPSVLAKEPTAELRPNQKDSDSIPPYAKLDPVLKGYIEKNLGLSDLSEKFNPALARRVVDLVESNEYKRRQAPPGIKITPLAFGKDRRYPITNRYHKPVVDRS